jgi:hypothetical protein
MSTAEDEAALKIQSVMRGALARKQVEVMKSTPPPPPAAAASKTKKMEGNSIIKKISTRKLLCRHKESGTITIGCSK